MAAEAFPTEYGTLIFHVTPDLGIFAYVFAISLAAGILFGLAPALESSRSALSSALKATRELRRFAAAGSATSSLPPRLPSPWRS